MNMFARQNQVVTTGSRKHKLTPSTMSTSKGRWTMQLMWNFQKDVNMTLQLTYCVTISSMLTGARCLESIRKYLALYSTQLKVED